MFGGTKCSCIDIRESEMLCQGETLLKKSFVLWEINTCEYEVAPEARRLMIKEAEVLQQ